MSAVDQAVFAFGADQATRLADAVITMVDPDALDTKMLSLSRSVGKPLLWPIALTALWLLGRRVREAQTNGATMLAASHAGALILVHDPLCPALEAGSACDPTCPAHGAWVILQEGT